MIIGLTGGIASGKSTVSRYLIEQGLAVLDADKLVHVLQAPGGRLYEALVAHFGAGILDQAGHLDRPKLAELIFSSPEQMAASSHLQDGIIREALRQELDSLLTKEAVVVLDIPLLFEKGYEAWCDQVWLVAVDEETQLNRLMARNGYPVEDAKKRMASQMPLAEKRQKAHAIIDNNGSLEETYKQVQSLLERLNSKW